MKRIFAILAVVLLTTMSLIAQEIPVGVKVVVKDETGKLLVNKKVGVKLSISKDVVMYSETHEVTTNENGVISLKFGEGEVLEGVYTEINWIEYGKLLKTEIDPAGGSNYTATIEEEIMAVPNAKAAKVAEALSDGSGSITYTEQNEINEKLRKEIDELKSLISNSNNIVDEFIFTNKEGTVIPGLSWRTKVESGNVKDSLEISFLAVPTKEYWFRDTLPVVDTNILIKSEISQTYRIKYYSEVKNYKIKSETSTEIIYSADFVMTVGQNETRAYCYNKDFIKNFSTIVDKVSERIYYVKHTRIIKK